MVTENNTPIQTTNVETIRKMSDKRYNELENSFNKQMDICQKLGEKIDLYQHILKEGKIVLRTEKDGTEVTKVLTSYELAGYRKALDEARNKLIREKKSLRLLGKRYSEASKRNAKVAKRRITQFVAKENLSSKARKNSDILFEATRVIVTSLEERKDARYNTLTEKLSQSQVSFTSELYKIIKTELDNKEYVEMISASSSVRTTIAKEIAKSLIKNQEQ